MAIGKSGVIGTLSGGVGGVEIQKGNERFILKRGKRSGAVTTPNRLRARTLMAGVRARWNALTAAQKNTWAALGQVWCYIDRFGTRRARNGFQAFAAIPCDFVSPGDAQYMTVAPSMRFGSGFVLGITATAPGEIMVSLTGPPASVALYCGVRVVRRCKNTTRKATRFLSLGMVTIVDASQIDFTTALSNRDQLLLAGEILYVEVYAYHPAYLPMVVGRKFVTVGA